MAYPMEQQQETDWCWDAVAVSVQRYFDPSSNLTQETFAEEVFDVTTPAQANQPFYLQNALAGLGKLSENPQGVLSFEDIQQQLDANLPVCVHIAWNEGGSHYVVITGYQVSPGGDAQVYVSDPIFQNSNRTIWDYQAFVSPYSPSYTNADGTWVDT
jgi:hypothetical protein